MGKQKNWTGERLETGVYNEATIEHLHRYAIACDLCAGKRVLDIACGEGYGSALLAAKAAAVTGVDSYTVVIEEATEKYKQPNLQFSTGRAENIPLADQAVDVVVSFETIEHLTDHEAMMKEIRRVLVPGGLLIMSTPDKKTYTDETGNKNPHHLKELYAGEFELLLKKHFRCVQISGQQLALSSLVVNGNAGSPVQYSGSFEKITSGPLNIKPVYLLALASDDQLPVLPSSIFNGDSVFRDALVQQEKMITGTITYRLGHYLLYPFKQLKKIFKR